MRLERLGPSGDLVALAAELRALVPGGELVQERAAEIVAEVRSRGDEAVLEYTRLLDTGGVEPRPLNVAGHELDEAATALDHSTAHGLQTAIENVRRVAEAALERGDRTVDLGTHRVTVRSAPVQSAAVYVPGGRAPYPSTVVMGVVPALAAGVEHVAVCSPPAQDGEIDPVVLAACRLAGARVVYRMGGAQAVAALAYGTGSVAPVDVIVGPGNLYVQEAKRQVSGTVGIDGFAGPSDLVVVADGAADPEPLALDLLAQAEHGPGTLVVGISDDEGLLEALARLIDEGPESEAIARLVQVRGLDEAMDVVQALAPEHLQLVGAGAEALAPRATRAGCVFVGPGAGTAFGDYVAGSNHILPTAGAARFASALSPLHFRRTFSEVRVDDASALARAAAPLARAEGFELHARSMEARIRPDRTIRDNQPT